MNETDVAAALQPRGCVIQTFEFHATFFGNWRACFSHAARRFEILSDNREGWMTLWEYRPDGTGKRLYEQRSHTFGRAEELVQLASWLDETLAR